MFRYVLAAAALKAFSATEPGRKAYRRIGNYLGGRTRKKGIKPGYIQRADGNLRFIEDQGAIADGMKVLELGTGWTHWEALFTRIFYDVEVTLFDVWDNRQFDGFLHYAQTLRADLRATVDRPGEIIDRAEALLDKVLLCRSFDEVYALLGFRYLVDPLGSLRAVPDASLDLVISSDVMEHIPRQSIGGLAADFARAVKPGGAVAQQIVMADHLCIYDRAVHPKNYLRYSDRRWKLLFDNDVQYVNRLQHSDFVKLFSDAGFEILREEITNTCDSSAIRIAREFSHYDRRDLDATVTRLIVRRPVRSN